MRGLGEGRVGRGEVRGVVVPVEHEIAGNAVEQLRRAFLQRGARVGDGGQRLVVDLDRFGGVLRLRQGLGDDERDRLAEMAHLADGERRARRIVARRAVPVVERRMAGHVAEAVGLHVVAGQHQQHAGHAARRRRVDLADVGVRDPRAQHVGLRHVGKRDVVGIAALAGDQGLVLETPNGLANAEFHDDSSVKIARARSRNAAPRLRKDGVWDLVRTGAMLTPGTRPAKSARASQSCGPSFSISAVKFADFLRRAVGKRRAHLAGAAPDDLGARLHDAHRIAGLPRAQAHVGHEEIAHQRIDGRVVARIDRGVEFERGARNEIEHRRRIGRRRRPRGTPRA